MLCYRKAEDLLSMSLQVHFLRAQRASDNEDGCKGISFCVLESSRRGYRYMYIIF